MISTTLALGSPSCTNAPAPAARAGAPTFHVDIEPILRARCQTCHAPGGLAPFPLVTFADVRALAPAIVAETTARRMPPWGAQDTAECTPPLPWSRDERLSEGELLTLAQWSAAGAPEGEPSAALARPEAPRRGLADVTETLSPRTAFVPSGDRDELRCFVLDHAHDAGAFITGIEVVPGNPRVVHHVVAFTDPDGVLAAHADQDGGFDCSSGAMLAGGGLSIGQRSTTLVVWSPGVAPVDLPPTIAIPLAAHSRIIMQVHYSPGGVTADADLTRLRLRTSATKPEYWLLTASIGNASSLDPATGDGLLPGPGEPANAPVFEIPKNVRDHVERMKFTIPPLDAKVRIYGVMVHQHLAGTNVKVELQRGASTQCLLEDQWDFHWQRLYTYRSPVEDLPTLEAGDTLTLRCTYNNTLGNRRLASELQSRHLSPFDMHLGEQTLDEMCNALPQLLVKVP